MTTVLGILSILPDLVFGPARGLWRWWRVTRPARKVLGPAAEQDQLVRVFVRDFFVDPSRPLLVRDGPAGPPAGVRNVHRLWSDVEGRGVAYVLNALGEVGKTEQIEIVQMSDDPGLWDSHFVLLGAQAQKCFDFYDRMESVAFRMDGNEIYDLQGGGEPIPREGPFGYGIILKAKNPFLRRGRGGVALLVGGFGTLGTAAAARYFRDHLADLGRHFGSRCFGVLVRAPASAGEQAVQRVERYDRRFK